MMQTNPLFSQCWSPSFDLNRLTDPMLKSAGPFYKSADPLRKSADPLLKSADPLTVKRRPHPLI